MIPLYDHQKKTLDRMHNGCILCGDVGSGKSRTALAYYFKLFGGDLDAETYGPMKDPSDLYIITTARKRDTFDWEKEMGPFLLSTHEDCNYYKNKVVVDSWNNIAKYVNVKNSFFIFDEQRVVGNGEWSSTFVKISHSNKWVLLSATPGDTWSDYIPVFLANGFFKNRTEFTRSHIVYSPFCHNFPKIDRYINEGRLIQLRNRILVNMDCDRKTVPHHIDVMVKYDIPLYKQIGKTRWNVYKDKPIETASELCLTWRRVVNEDESRQIALLNIFEDHPRIIVFYNFDYELDILKNLYYGDDVEVAEWNGHKHQPIPECESWVYLVQYTAGAEGWNCVKTDTIVFYSLHYSYKILHQSAGRINRINTPFVDLYYYHLRSASAIDLAIARALRNKKKFNESRYLQKIKYPKLA